MEAKKKVEINLCALFFLFKEKNILRENFMYSLKNQNIISKNLGPERYLFCNIIYVYAYIWEKTRCKVDKRKIYFRIRERKKKERVVFSLLPYLFFYLKQGRIIYPQTLFFGVGKACAEASRLEILSLKNLPLRLFSLPLFAF